MAIIHSDKRLAVKVPSEGWGQESPKTYLFILLKRSGPLCDQGLTDKGFSYNERF